MLRGIPVMLTTVACLAWAPAAPAADVRIGERDATLSAPSYRARFSLRDGHLIQWSPGNGGAPILDDGGDLWRVTFADGTALSSGEFGNDPQHTLQAREDAGTLELLFTAPQLRVGVRLEGGDDGVTLIGAIEETAKAIERFDLPAQVRFAPERVNRVVFPQRGSESLGLAFRRPFFERHAAAAASGYSRALVGPAAYTSLCGPVTMHPDNAEATRLTVTPAGTAILDRGTQALAAAAQPVINRPPEPGPGWTVFVDSPAGPALAGADFGGKGLFMRFGGKVTEGEDSGEGRLQVALVVSATRGLARARAEAFRGKTIALVSLTGGPPAGGWSSTPVSTWEGHLSQLEPVRDGTCAFALIRDPDSLREALASDRYALILNPYGEWLPTGDAERVTEDIGALRDFVRKGGIWWEVGGHPFYYVMEPLRYNSHRETYPPAVADFTGFETTSGNLAVFGVQPLMRKPWEGADDPAKILTPADLATGGDENGGYWSHSWHADVAPGERRTFPPLVLLAGGSTPKALETYAARIGLTRTLEEKVPDAALREKLKGAVLIRVGAASAAEHRETLDYMPPGSIVHFAEYLHGGFDKQYPDHLPPRDSWGTSEDLAEFYRKGQELGLLMMPYTNTSWWCIGPKGPTFEREGEAPLAKRRDGSLYLERYSTNEGYTVSYWHPAVIRAHRLTRQQMTEEYPSDILLQDQVGARGWLRDYNPAMPSPFAGVDGLHSLSMEDADHVPLATEDGYDRVAQFETMLCGMAWGTVPADGRYATRHNRYRFPQGDWEFYPILGYLAHDKTLFALHDLGHFVTDDERLAWVVAFGYSLSVRTGLGALQNAPPRRFLNWLDTVQKTVCSRYAGEPLREFGYPIPGNPDIISSKYGPVRIVANVGQQPFPEDFPTPWPETDGTGMAEALRTARPAAPGFLAAGPGFRAGTMATDGEGGRAGFAARTTDTGLLVRVYARPGTTLAIPVPGLPKNPRETVRELAGTEPEPPRAFRANGAANGVLHLTTPRAPAGQTPPDTVPAPLAGQAPKSWTGRGRTIAVPDFGPDAPTSWTDVRPEDWLAAVEASPVLRQAGFRVLRVETPEELLRLVEGPAANRPFAVINPGGEVFYGPRAGEGRRVLAAIRDYIRSGGVWWEVGGYSLYSYASPRPGGTGEDAWLREPVGPSGADFLGFRCAGHEVEAPPVPLRVTESGKTWLGADRAARIEGALSGAQRTLVGANDVLTPVTGGGEPFVAGIRCGGWGWLWRLGGFRPPPAIATDCVVGVLEHLVSTPWPEPARSREMRLWEFAFEADE